MKKSLSNNKGFSLVELIIVIAIMAVLIGILAPQYMRYVERTRLTADNDYIDAVRKACETAVSDPNTEITGNFTVTFSANAVPNISDQTALGEIDEIIDVDTANECELTSRTYTNAANMPTITVEWEADDAGVMVPTVTVTNIIQ